MSEQYYGLDGKLIEGPFEVVSEGEVSESLETLVLVSPDLAGKPLHEIDLPSHGRPESQIVELPETQLIFNEACECVDITKTRWVIQHKDNRLASSKD